ncbi:ATP-binding protein [Photobacterium damselae]|uniref:ATP-binding protein n=1 Tax=Photobacterium damselae TaxID=38293 RepID=UPI003B6820CF
MTVDANPTKEFFMTMLTRDISLTSAILDLIDNSIDAARKIGNLSERIIELKIDGTSFSMKDNCGGMPKEVAERYAFKFGRDSNAPSTANSVGRFGVGMKRAFFKIGNNIEVSSQSAQDSFVVSINAEQWKESPNWEFDLQDESLNLDEDGLKIQVESLHETVIIDFSDSVYINELIKFIANAHYKAISDGVRITVNAEPVPSRDLEIKQSDSLGVLGKEYSVRGVTVKIICGIGERDLKAGGWNIFCNGRLIEGANKTNVTGWGTNGLRAYHADLAYFRGVVEFSSDNGELLPWNTTKNGVDIDNPIYKSVLVEMTRMTKIIAKFLADRAREKEALEKELITDAPINESIDSAGRVSAFNAIYREVFVREELVLIPRNTDKRVSYVVTNEQLELAKEIIGVNTASEVGRYTFTYFMESEN